MHWLQNRSPFPASPWYRLLTVLVLLEAFAGCKPAHELETAPVHGAVTLDGKPLAGGGVMFVPDRGRGAVGAIASDGTYTVGTYGETDGAIVGRHKVAVFPGSDTSQFEDLSAQPKTPTIPPRYQSAVTSGIEVEVKADQDNTLNIRLTSAPTIP